LPGSMETNGCRRSEEKRALPFRYRQPDAAISSPLQTSRMYRMRLRLQAKHDPILVVDPHRVEPSQISAEGVHSVTGRHLQIVKPSHRVDLIEFASETWAAG
jgi:hypothetical protein